MDIHYICDRKACDNCSYPECKHTEDINHAVHFSKEINYKGEECFLENEDLSNDELYKRLMNGLSPLLESR